jgi:hypothetical protein
VTAMFQSCLMTVSQRYCSYCSLLYESLFGVVREFNAEFWIGSHHNVQTTASWSVGMQWIRIQTSINAELGNYFYTEVIRDCFEVTRQENLSRNILYFKNCLMAVSYSH